MEKSETTPGTMFKVHCQLGDCLFYYRDPAQPGLTFCKHLEKPHYLHSLPCPLYRVDWQKNAAASQALLKKFS